MADFGVSAAKPQGVWSGRLAASQCWWRTSGSPGIAPQSALSLIGTAEGVTVRGRLEREARGSFDNVRWRKPLVWAADAAGYGF